jgi:hypothetical protein
MSKNKKVDVITIPRIAIFIAACAVLFVIAKVIGSSFLGMVAAVIGSFAFTILLVLWIWG